MIFEKILKGTDLAFDITLDKTQYRPEEIVRGTIYLKTEKSSKARRLMLFAEGKESTIITVSENTGGGSSSRSTTTRTYSETDTFFSEDLSHFLQKSVSSNVLDEGILEISPQNKKIAFEFKLPGDDRLFSSYKGKHANITYAVKATVDIAKRLDVNKEEHFSVFNYNNKVVLYSSDKSSLNEEDKTATVSSSTIENEFPSSATTTETIEDSTSKESYSARFERLFDKKSNRTASSYGHPPSRSFTFSGTGINFDLGSIFAKGREHFLKENSEAKIDLLNHANNNTSYSPGHIIKGKVILLSHLNQEIEEKKKNKKIKGLKITLSGVENAFAQGRQRISTIEKYEKNIGLDEYGENNNRSVAFEFQIPDKVNQSYTGKYSEYFCGLEAKLNIAWSSDINARTIIEVV
jgi:hypothetical protein